MGPDTSQDDAQGGPGVPGGTGGPDGVPEPQGEPKSRVQRRLGFAAAVALRDRIERDLGWTHDAITIEGDQDRGHRVVLAWSDGKLERVTSFGEAESLKSGGIMKSGNVNQP